MSLESNTQMEEFLSSSGPGPVQVKVGLSSDIENSLELDTFVS